MIHSPSLTSKYISTHRSPGKPGPDHSTNAMPIKTSLIIYATLSLFNCYEVSKNKMHILGKRVEMYKLTFYASVKKAAPGRSITSCSSITP